jgi:hypothetical protein
VTQENSHALDGLAASQISETFATEGSETAAQAENTSASGREPAYGFGAGAGEQPKSRTSSEKLG